MPLIVYGIRNCNTVKSALTWLKDHNVDYEFHDFKSRGITGDKLKEWSKQVGWQSLVNKRGTTWRQLPADTQESVTNETAAIALMMERTSVIRRPIVEKGNRILTLGFDAGEYVAKVR